MDYIDLITNNNITTLTLIYGARITYNEYQAEHLVEYTSGVNINCEIMIKSLLTIVSPDMQFFLLNTDQEI